jgi:hypothetical protein
LPWFFEECAEWDKRILELSPYCGKSVSNISGNLIKKEAKWNLVVEILPNFLPSSIERLNLPTIRYMAYHGPCLSEPTNGTCPIGSPTNVSFEVICNTRRRNCHIKVCSFYSSRRSSVIFRSRKKNYFMAHYYVSVLVKLVEVQTCAKATFLSNEDPLEG